MAACNPDTSAAFDELTRDAGQLAALLAMIDGEGGDAFATLADHLRRDYLSCAATLAQRVHLVAYQLATAPR